MTDPADIVIDEEKALKWLRRGAQPSDTAKRLLNKHGILMKFEYERLGKPMPQPEGAPADEPEPTTETQEETAPETDALLTEAPPEATEEEE